jgi:thiamine biosynthesis protein ThiI
VETTASLENISTVALILSKKCRLTKEKSFAIRATRAGTHSFTSQDVAVHVGNDIVKITNARVDLTHPDIEIFIEIRNKKAFIFTTKISGPSGLPVGTQGTILALIDKPSSLLAAWYLLHRGCDIIVANTKKSNEKSIRSFLTYWYVHADIIPVKPTSPQFFQHLKRIAFEKNCDALATDDTLEDPIQTLTSITKMKKQSALPVLTPLIAMEKKEIQKKCKEVGIPL